MKWPNSEHIDGKSGLYRGFYHIFVMKDLEKINFCSYESGWSKTKHFLYIKTLSSL